MNREGRPVLGYVDGRAVYAEPLIEGPNGEALLELTLEECRNRWHDQGPGRRPDCPSCGVEDEE